MQINLQNLSDEQFEHILNLLIVYAQANKDKDVYLNEKCIKEAIQSIPLEEGDLLIITGSLYLCGEFLKLN